MYVGVLVELLGKNYYIRTQKYNYSLKGEEKGCSTEAKNKSRVNQTKYVSPHPSGWMYSLRQKFYR